MPPKRVFRRKRPIAKRKKFIRRPRAMVRFRAGPNVMGNIPTLQHFRLVFPVQLNPTGGSKSFVRFIPTSCHYPVVDNPELQPMRWDQMRAIYGEYIVLGCKITVTRIGFQPGDGASVADAWGIYLEESATGIPLNFQDLIEQGRGCYKLSNNTNNQASSKLRLGYSLKKFFNIKDPQDNFAQFGAQTSSAPNKNAYFILWQQRLQSGEPVTAQFLVQMDFCVRFGKPRSQPSSS